MIVWKPPRSPGAVPAGFCGMLALMIVVECTLAGNNLEFKHFFTYDWVMTGRWVTQRARGREILCFGDSLVKFGVAPRILEERLGGRAYNFAVCGGQASTSYFLLRRVLDSGARPDTIVVDFIPHLLARGPRHNNRQWPELVTLSEFVDLIRATQNTAFATSLALAKLVPSVKDRFEIRENLLAALGGQRVALREELLERERSCDTHQGAILAPAVPHTPRTFDLSHWEEFPRIWSCHPVNAGYLERFLNLAQSRGISVFWVLPPVSPEAQARRERLGIERSYRAFVRQVQSRFSNLTVVDGRHTGLDSSVFVDPLHLDHRGAAALSAGLAEVIAGSQSTASAGRWVDVAASLPSGIDVQSDVPVPSRLALGSRDTEKPR
jgi:hypothetical protein